MEVRIQAINFDATEKLIAFINKKADRLQRHFPAISDIEVKLTTGELGVSCVYFLRDRDKLGIDMGLGFLIFPRLLS